MKRLFNEDEDERWTVEANEIALRADRALRPIFNDAIDAGISMRDLAYVLESTVQELSLCVLLGPPGHRKLLE